MAPAGVLTHFKLLLCLKASQDKPRRSWATSVEDPGSLRGVEDPVYFRGIEDPGSRRRTEDLEPRRKTVSKQISGPRRRYFWARYDMALTLP